MGDFGFERFDFLDRIEVLARVFFARKDLEVLGTVVGLVAVDVMDVLIANNFIKVSFLANSS